MKKSMIAELKKRGFKADVEGYVYDLGNFRVCFEDYAIEVYKFDSPKTKLIEARSEFDMAFGKETILKIVDAFISA